MHVSEKPKKAKILNAKNSTGPKTICGRAISGHPYNPQLTICFSSKITKKDSFYMRNGPIIKTGHNDKKRKIYAGYLPAI